MSGQMGVPRGKRWPAAAVAGLAWLLGMGTLYRETLTSGFEVLHGGDLDQRLLIYLSEHWFRVLGGDAAWRDPSAFYPVANDLGYSDSLVLFQLAYAPLRWMGFDQFVAFAVTGMALTTIGYVSTLVLVHRVFRVRFGVAVIAAFAFAFGNHIAMQTQHAQLLAAELMPVVALGIAGSVALLRRADGGQRVWAVLLAGATGGLTGLILFTSYYIGWFMVVVAGFAAVCVAVCAPGLARSTAHHVRRHVGGLALLGGSFALGLGVALIPFFITYVPVLEVSGGRTFDEVAFFAPQLANLVRFGDGNLVWGQVVPLWPGVSPGIVGVPTATPVLAVSAAIGVVVMLVHVRGVASLRAMQQRLQIAAGLMLAAALTTLASLRFGQWTAWRWVWELVPGATAIRVPGRVGMVVTLLVVVAWALVADAVWTTIRPWFAATGPRAPARRLAAGAIAAVAVLVMVEQVQVNSVQNLIRSREVALVNSVGQPPPDCAAFYLVDPVRRENDFGAPSVWRAQMDALLVSHAAGIPTLNGYSGLTPPDWELDNPMDPGYQQAAQAWIQRHNLGGTVCTYAATDGQWSTTP